VPLQVKNLTTNHIIQLILKTGKYPNNANFLKSYGGICLLPSVNTALNTKEAILETFIPARYCNTKKA